MIAVDIALAGLGGLLMAPSLVFGAECTAAMLPQRKRSPTRHQRRPHAVIVVPAHDEATGIAATVRHLRESMGRTDRLVVVADNCTDATAQHAREAGATVLERVDPERRGKGYALSHAFDALREDPPDVVVVVDADCRLTPGSVDVLVRQAAALVRPVQAEYLMRPDGESIRTGISAFAFLVRNRVRPRGLDRLGLPCHLTGTGMAFPWPLLDRLPSAGAHIVEDLVLGLELAERGHPPLFCPAARVVSELPRSAGAALTQRKRWEHGQLSTLLERAPRLVTRGLRERRGDLVGLGLDLSVPPLALLVLLQLGFVGVAGASFLVGGSIMPLSLGLGAIGITAVGVGLAWMKFGRGVLPWYKLLATPAYVVWKLPLYAGFLLGRRAREWRRTERTAEKQP